MGREARYGVIGFWTTFILGMIAGSIVVFDASIWHGHGANSTAQSRRSIQGYFVRRDARSGLDWPTRMQPNTLARLDPLARYLLAL